MSSKVRNPIIAGIVLLVVAVFVGEVFNVYNTFPHFDKLLHITGGVIVACFFDYWFLKKFNLSPLERFILLVGTVALVGVLWEFAERLSSVYGPAHFPFITHYFYGGDLNDTLGDLLADLIGGALYGLFRLKNKNG